MCAGGPPNPMHPMRVHSRATTRSVTSRRDTARNPESWSGRRTGDTRVRPAATAAEHLRHQLRQRRLRVAEQHRARRRVVQVVVDPGEAGLHRALEHDHLSRLVDLEDRHAVDRRVGAGARRRVRHVVRPDDEHHVGARELGVDVVHLDEQRVRDVGLGEQHVHVAGHPPRDRVDRVADVDLACLQQVGELADDVLGLGDREAVAGHDDDALRERQHDGRVVHADLAHDPVRRDPGPRLAGRSRASRIRTRRTARS